MCCTRIEIMNWDFAVRSVDVDSVGRIMWTVEYPKKGPMPDPYDSGPSSHLFATVNIVAYQPKQLVAVFKVSRRAVCSVQVELCY